MRSLARSRANTCITSRNCWRVYFAPVRILVLASTVAYHEEEKKEKKKKEEKRDRLMRNERSSRETLKGFPQRSFLGRTRVCWPRHEMFAFPAEIIRSNKFARCFTARNKVFAYCACTPPSLPHRRYLQFISHDYAVSIIFVVNCTRT